MPLLLVTLLSFFLLTNNASAAPFELIGCEDSTFYLTNVRKDCLYTSPFALKFKSSTDELTFQAGMIVASLSPCKNYILTIPGKKKVAQPTSTIQDNITKITGTKQIEYVFSDAANATDWLINNHGAPKACSLLSRLPNPFVHLFRYR